MRDTSFGDANHPSFVVVGYIDLVCSFRFRPETVESLFIAFRLTGDERFRKFGWGIFQAIEAHCRVETGGYSSVWNVDAVPTTSIDNMETFFLVRNQSFTLRRPLTVEQSETLKYLYLLFSDPSTLPLKGGCPDAISSADVLGGYSLMFVASFCRLCI